MEWLIIGPILFLVFSLSLASLSLALVNRPGAALKDFSAVTRGVTCPACGMVWPFRGTGPATLVCRDVRAHEGCGHQFVVGVVREHGPKRLFGLIPGVPSPSKVQIKSREKQG
jgi:hypothetical protein